MYLVVIAWFYVTLLMALAEALSTQGTVLGALITFVLYGLVPISLVIYLFGSPLRRKARKKAEQTEALAAAASVVAPDASGHAPTLPKEASITPVGKIEP